MVSFVALALLTAPVEIRGEHVLLVDIVSSAPSDIGALEIASAPSPGKSKVITRRRVRRRLAEAKASLRGVAIPARVVVTRASQTLDELALTALVTPIVRSSAPNSVHVGEIRVRGAVVLPAGAISAEVQWPRRPRGSSSLRTLLFVDGAYAASTLVHVELQERSDAATVKRGDRVTVLAQVGSVSVRGVGIAQNKARVGEVVRVLPDRAVRVVEGWVRSDGSVEVRP